MFLLLQIGELFKGNYNWRGALHLALFIIMGLLVIGFSTFFIKKVLEEKKNRK